MSNSLRVRLAGFVFSIAFAVLIGCASPPPERPESITEEGARVVAALIDLCGGGSDCRDVSKLASQKACRYDREPDDCAERLYLEVLGICLGAPQR